MLEHWSTMSVPVEHEQVERRVVDTLPYPIAVNLANARRARLADASERELHHLLATGEALIHLLGSVCLLDLAPPRSTSNVAARLDDALAPNEGFIPKPDRPSVGDWIHFIGKSTKHVEHPFLRETAGWSQADRAELLDLFHGVRRLRNDFSHPHPTPSEVRAQNELPTLRPLHFKILKHTIFFSSYTMLAVGDRKDGQVLVTRLRGSTLPQESHWLGLMSAIEREGVVRVDRDVAEQP